MSDLAAVVRRIDADLDPVAVAGDDGLLWRHPGITLAGRGVALEVPVAAAASAPAEVAGALGGLPVDRDVDGVPGPVALGALPFDDRRAGVLRVPRILYGRAAEGTRWLCWVGRGPVPSLDALVAELAAPRDPVAAPTEFRLRPPRPAEEWCAAVAGAREQIRRGTAAKVVLAREVLVECDVPIPRQPVLARLGRAFPTCYLFATPELLGASPELLVSRRGDVVRSQPMAGTAPRSPDSSADAALAARLLASDKDRVEHQITIERVHDTLLPWCSYLDATTDPQVVTVANVHHLATGVQGRLSRPLPSVLELVRALHPTPAVCGDPTEAARSLIERFEAMDRGSYAAPVGWVDAEGDGEWAVGVRSAEVRGPRARLFAGVGVVADSDPRAELEETQVKLEAMLGAILRL